jgi:hypothetical protein
MFPAGIPVPYVVEGTIDAAVVRVLLRDVGIMPGTEYIMGGKAALDRRLPGYNAAARRSPWLVVRDLDEDADCAPSLIAARVPQPAPFLCLRIAVRQIESWLVADRVEMAAFLGVPLERVAREPDRLPDPKRHLVELARQSRRRDIRDGLAVRSGSGIDVGPAYVPLLTEFVECRWSPRRAAEEGRSDSLVRTVRRLRRFADEGRW